MVHVRDRVGQSLVVKRFRRTPEALGQVFQELEDEKPQRPSQPDCQARGMAAGVGRPWEGAGRPAGVATRH